MGGKNVLIYPTEKLLSGLTLYSIPAAGIVHDQPFLEHSPDAWRRVMDVNVRYPANVTTVAESSRVT